MNGDSRSLLQEEKSEDWEDSFIANEPSFVDSEGLAYVSVAAKQAPVMADVSEHTMKKKVKKKKKKLSKSRTHRRSSAIIEDTDPETSDIPIRPPRKRKKSKTKSGYESRPTSRSRSRSSKRADESNGHASEKATKKSRSKKARSKSSKKKRKRREREVINARNEAENKGEGEGEGEGKDITEKPKISKQNEVHCEQPLYYPPELNSDSSSSYIPDPSDLEAEDEYESASTRSSIERDANQGVFPPTSLLGDKTQDLEPDIVELEASPQSLQLLSAPPQLIPGSLANDMLISGSADTLEVKHHSPRRQFDTKCKAIVAMTVLLAASIVVIVVLATRGKEQRNSEPLVIPAMLSKWEITMQPYTASYVPGDDVQKEWAESTASYVQKIFAENFEAVLSLASFDALTFQHSAAPSSLAVEFITSISPSTNPPQEDFEFIAREVIKSLEGDEFFLSEIIDQDPVFASIEVILVQERILASTRMDACISGLQEVVEEKGRLSLTEYIDFLSRQGSCDAGFPHPELNVERVYEGFGFSRQDGSDQVIDLDSLTRKKMRRLCVVSSELASFCPELQTSVPSSSPTVADTCPFGLFFLGSGVTEGLYSMDRFDRGMFLEGSSSIRNLTGLAYDFQSRKLFASHSGPVFNVFEVDPATGENRSGLELATRQPGSLSAIEVIDGSIYGITDSLELHTFTTDLAPTRVGQVNAAESISDLAWTGSTLYGITSNGLYSILEQTGEATMICSLRLHNYSSLVYYSPEQLLYGGAMDGAVVEIDPNDCSETIEWTALVPVMELAVVCREFEVDQGRQGLSDGDS